MKLAVVIPAYNEEETIGSVIRKIRAVEFPGLEAEVIVIDDGSTDRTAGTARSEGARVIHHVINRGLGGALGTGLETALRAGADVIVTVDADGQHAAGDIARVIGPVRAGDADVVIGTRMLEPGRMPWTRRLANRIANIITRVLFGIATTDSQSGFRAFSREAAGRIRVRSNRYEVSSEICHEIKRHRLRLREVPVESIYTPYSLSKGQGFLTGLRTLARLVLSRWGGKDAAPADRGENR